VPASFREATQQAAAMVIVDNLTVPGWTARVDAEGGHALREAIRRARPATPQA